MGLVVGETMLQSSCRRDYTNMSHRAAATSHICALLGLAHWLRMGLAQNDTGTEWDWLRMELAQNGTGSML